MKVQGWWSNFLHSHICKGIWHGFSFTSFLEEYSRDVISLFFVVVFFVFAMDRYGNATANFHVKEWYIPLYIIYIYIFHYIPLCIPLYIFVILNCVKSVRIQSFSGPHFPAFRLNREIYFVNFRVQSESRKIWTRKTTITDSFYSVFKLDLHLFG